MKAFQPRRTRAELLQLKDDELQQYYEGFSLSGLRRSLTRLTNEGGYPRLRDMVAKVLASRERDEAMRPVREQLRKQQPSGQKSRPFVRKIRKQWSTGHLDRKLDELMGMERTLKQDMLLAAIVHVLNERRQMLRG